MPIADERVRVFLFVATLGYSRRGYVAAFRHERQSSWFRGLEGTFRHFGGVTKEVLIDNPRPLVLDHDAATHAVEFNDRFLAFAAYWGFRPRACAPYRTRTKGKDERGVGYVKGNAIAGHRFKSWTGMEAHLAWWQREIADRRRHGTTGEVPLVRFEREAELLRPFAGRPPFGQLRGSDPDGPRRLRGGGRHQRLFGAVAADRRAGTGGGQRRSGARSPRTGCRR